MKPEHAATEVLSSMYGDYNLVQLPIDPVVVARSLGINVWQSEMDNTISGVIMRLKGAGGEIGGTDIYLNNTHAPARQRFTTAHEIGHYIRHNAQFGTESEMYYKRAGLAACGTDSDEIYANQFGASLLMPADYASLYAPTHDQFALARLFGVSVDAIGHRLTNLNIRPVG